MEEMLRMLTNMLQQQGAISNEEQKSTQALQTIIRKLGRFDGRDITKYLCEYICEMEINRVSEAATIESFELAVQPHLRAQVRKLGEKANGEKEDKWADYEQRLKAAFVDDDTDRVTKRTFLDWLETRPGKSISLHNLLREFEARFAQLPSTDKATMNLRKTELFLEVVEEDVYQSLLLFLADAKTEAGVTNDWKKVEEAVAIITKQQKS